MKVAFLGHRTGFDDTGKAEATFDVLKKELKGEPAEFLMGVYGMYDFIARKSCGWYKRLYGNSKIILVVHNDNRYPNKKKSPLHDEVVSLDLQSVPQSELLFERDKRVVDMADLIICYFSRNRNDIRKAIEYAVKKQKRIINIGRINIEKFFSDKTIKP